MKRNWRKSIVFESQDFEICLFINVQLNMLFYAVHQMLLVAQWQVQYVLTLGVRRSNSSKQLFFFARPLNRIFQDIACLALACFARSAPSPCSTIR